MSRPASHPDRLLVRAAFERCSAAVTVGGQTFEANDNTAFIVARFSHALPASTVNGLALHPATIANSWKSIVLSRFNYNHTAELTLGTVLAAEFPEAPADGWTIGTDPAKAPAIRAACALHRTAKFAPEILKLHADGDLEWEVSMEVFAPVEAGAFAVRREAGWEFIPHADAPAALKKLWVKEKGKNGYIAGKWEDCETCFLLGGVGGQVQYLGLALTPKGAEPTNEVETVLASQADLATALKEFVAAGRALLGT
jgi:hypothetical protein